MMSACAKTAARSGSNLCALFGVSGVRVARFGARALFDEHFDAGLCQVGNYQRHQRHAPLAGETLFGDADDHESSPVVSIWLYLRRAALECDSFGRSASEDESSGPKQRISPRLYVSRAAMGVLRGTLRSESMIAPQ